MKYPCKDCLVDPVCSDPCKDMIILALNLHKGKIEIEWVDSSNRAERLRKGVLMGARVPEYTFSIDRDPMLQKIDPLNTQVLEIDEVIALDNEIQQKFEERVRRYVNAVRNLPNKSKV